MTVTVNNEVVKAVAWARNQSGRWIWKGDVSTDFTIAQSQASVYQKANPNLQVYICLLYTSPSPRDQRGSRMPSSA